MGDGDLTTAMRASMSVPGVFAPVEYRDLLLVDGGLAETLPIDVARSMGVDVLIVVDTGFPLQQRKNLDSLPSITNQMLTILLGRDAARQRKTLGPNDIVITPQLGDFSSYDFAETLKIVSAGETATQALVGELERLALPEGGVEATPASGGGVGTCSPVCGYENGCAGGGAGDPGGPACGTAGGGAGGGGGVCAVPDIAPRGGGDAAGGGGTKSPSMPHAYSDVTMLNHAWRRAR